MPAAPPDRIPAEGTGLLRPPLFGDGEGAHVSARAEKAAGFFRKALQLQAQQQELEAASNYARALHLQPDFYEAAFNLGLLLQKKGQLAAAVECYRRATQLCPAYAPAWNCLGVALRDLGQHAQAIESLGQALRLKPGWPVALNNLGNALRSILRYDDAIAAFHLALAGDPGNAGIYENLGNALRETGRTGEAVAALRRALGLRPDFAEAHWDLGFALLQQGDLAEGFKEYEWRWRLADFPKREFAAPLWQGQDLSGRTLLVHAEQGAGDALQFVRFVGTLARRGAQVIVECPRPLASVLATAEGVSAVVRKGEPLPPSDYHVPLLSLPLRLGISSVPAQTPYLQAPPEGRSTALPSAPAGAGALKVGLAWQGNPRQKNDRQRSCALEALSPLLEVRGATFYSLQMPPAGQAAAASENPGASPSPAGGGADNLIPLRGLIQDYGDTARLMEQLDLIITVDTSVAHLAGALGRPVWVLLCFAPCWRWQLHRTDSPWYPSMRLFRQPAPGDWRTVIANVCAALQGSINL